MKSFLYQFVEQLQFVLDNMGVANNATTTTPKSATPTPKDTANPEATFSAIKSLIIKSADIVQAYYDEISTRLSGMYVAESDFGTFVETTEQEINQTSTDIEQIFANVQQIFTDIEDITFTLAEVNAHIRSGLLFYDDDSVPVYGLEVGQKNTIDGEEVFNKYARFTSDRLSFYDHNDVEVAYISDYKLYITNAEVTGTLKLGAFRIDTSKGFTLKYVGRG
jgi:hypothetical protein